MIRSAKGSWRLRRHCWALVLLLVCLPPASIGAQEAAATKFSLPELINLGLEKQPALAAARSSMAAAESSLQGLNNLKFASIFAKDLPIRKEQACLGVTIAAASLEQAEWETRYAVVRNYYSVVYAREQLTVVRRMKGKLKDALDKVIDLLKEGNPEYKVSTLDRQMLELNLQLVNSKEIEARIGISKAFAALREALGVGLDFQLDIPEGHLPALVTDLDRKTLIAMALANRGEITQAASAFQVTALEVQAQGKIKGPNGRTFAGGADIHARPIPQGVANGEYRPGAIGLEMPASLAGKKADREERAQHLNDRAGAVVDKTNNLVALEADATYLKWLEAKEKVKGMEGSNKVAADITDKVKQEFDKGKLPGEAILRAQAMEEQIAASYNEALYLHALALAALERVTAGGYRITKQP
jgi:outer membrane protein TolC